MAFMKIFQNAEVTSVTISKYSRQRPITQRRPRRGRALVRNTNTNPCGPQTEVCSCQPQGHSETHGCLCLVAEVHHHQWAHESRTQIIGKVKPVLGILAL